VSKREIILNTATRLFSEKGYHNTALAEVARLTGVAEGTIFYHFNTKEELFASILENIKFSIAKKYGQFLKERQFIDGLDRLESSISFYLFLVGTMEEMFLILHRYDAYELAQENPVFRLHFTEIYNFILDVFEKAILQGREDGSMNVDSTGKAAFIIFTMVDGVARLRTFNIYDAASLYGQLQESCRRILQGRPAAECR
jgi:TetR/AcrR family transcriptional regulator, fatty acid metabolism regulator protein